LINFNQALPMSGLLGQRGIVLTVIFAVATVYMISDKAQRSGIRQGEVSEEDQVIRTLSGELEDIKEPSVIISQWPARTLLATKQTTLPLPPAASDAQTLLKNLQGAKANFLLFNPYDKRNAPFARQVSELSQTIKTIMATRSAVLWEVATAPAKQEPPTPRP
jgi:hypothetical protein